MGKVKTDGKFSNDLPDGQKLLRNIVKIVHNDKIDSRIRQGVRRVKTTHRCKTNHLGWRTVMRRMVRQRRQKPPPPAVTDKRC
ncbi:hypothetical protein EVAR_6527_1 [Eumeta japonica]|uniref:Uncharacterized protein n=1 Tax=Eumeta variegata TaxID=151549 RepID=A0A4C1SSU1_EUMVA|nr:hypothetical protein EVAR_6527_1 [Eumeta japonica]